MNCNYYDFIDHQFVFSELIRNMTLKYLSRTLPILKADETLPKVAQMQDDLISQNTYVMLKMFVSSSSIKIVF